MIHTTQAYAHRNQMQVQSLATPEAPEERLPYKVTRRKGCTDLSITAPYQKPCCRENVHKQLLVDLDSRRFRPTTDDHGQRHWSCVKWLIRIVEQH